MVIDGVDIVLVITRKAIEFNDLRELNMKLTHLLPQQVIMSIMDNI